MDYIYVGKIVNTHGIKGEIRIISNFKYKDRIFKKKMNIYIGKNKDKEVINGYRHHKKFDMILMDGYDNINQVLKYKGLNVYIDRQDLILSNSEYLDEDLIGLNIRINNEIVGTVIKILTNSSQKLFVVSNGKREILIPYVKDIIENINFKDGYIDISYIEGLV